MSSDDDDLFNYTPLQRSQVSTKEFKSKPKASRLSTSRSQITEKKIKATTTTTTKAKSTPTKAKSTPTKAKSTPTKAKRTPTKKGTPVKSRADHPEENCTGFELAKWNFLYGSQVSKAGETSQHVKRKSLSGDSSSDSLTSSRQKKNAPQTSNYQSTSTKQNGVKKDSNARTSSRNSLGRKGSGGSSYSKSSNRNFLKHNGAGDSSLSSRSRSPSRSAKSSKLPDIIMVSDDEGDVSINNDFESVPLFELKEPEEDKPLSDKKCEKEEDSCSESSALLEPEIDLFEEEQTTLYFDSANGSPASPTKEQKNDKSPANSIHDDNIDSSGSTTPDMLNIEPEAAALEDSGDEIIANIAEEAIDHFALPVVEKVMTWKKSCEEAQTKTSKAPENRPNPDLNTSHKTIVQPLNIHFHFHEASPVSSHCKESGQRSILAYFKPTTDNESGSSGKQKTFSMKESIAAWKGVMNTMRRGSLVSIPSVSQSSTEESSKNSHTRPSRYKQGSGNTNSRWRRKDAAQVKSCPFYKYIPETNFVVDAFSYGIVDGVTAYFLSHFHYDHYCGLKKNFNQPIYCSEITARLVNKRLGVPLQYLHPLPMWEPQQVCGVEVTLLNANHCPGAVMFLFKVKSGVKHLHVGDFRAHPSMESYQALQCSINTLFLDTTYCSPDHVFPTQEKMVEKCVSLAQDHYQRNSKTLFVVGSYTIGKEKVFQAIASSLDCSIWVRDYKKQILKCIDDREIQTRLHVCKTTAKVHVLPMKEIRGEKLLDYLNQLRPSFNEIVGICPTGWEFTGVSLDGISRKHPYPDVYIYGIPYSEHSSFSELQRFVKFIKPKKIIPTVNNGNQQTRKQMQEYFVEWQR